MLSVLVAAFMLALVSSAAETATAKGGDIEIADAVRVSLAAGLTLIILRQVPAMAAGLASGIALSRFRCGEWRGTRNAAAPRPLHTRTIGSGHLRWDPMTRKGGFYAGRAVSSLMKGTL